MNLKRRALSLLMALTFIFGTVGNLAVYAVDDVHTHEHTTLDETSDTTDEPEEPPTAHTHKYDTLIKVIKSSTCKETGTGLFKCTYSGCDATIEKSLPLADHSPKTDRTEPNCGKAGLEVTKCSECGITLNIKELPATGSHNFSEWYQSVPADCQKDGEERRDCKDCDAYETRTLKGDHIWGEWSVTIAATCEKKGKEVRKCTVNRCKETEERDIEATGHNYVHKTIPKTCTENGKEWDECTNCGDKKNEKVLEAIGHVWDYDHGEITKKPTCTVGGETTYKCKNCDAKDTLKNIEPLGHDYGAWQITNATCTKAGEKKRTCSRCKGTETVVIEATGHKSSDWQIKKEATCTEAGIKHKVCLVCGEELESINYELNPKGHTWSAWQTTKEPTYDTAGEETRTCTRCGAKETNRLPTIAKDHTHSFNGKQSVIKKASCTESGKNRVYCSHKGCNEYKEITTEALGHAFGDYEVTQEADCINTGVRRCECSRCGATQSETTPPLGHQYSEWVVTRESSDTESGIRQRTCDICGDIQIETFLGTPEEVDVNATLPNGTHGVTLTVPNGQTMTDEERKAKNRKKAVGVTVITVAFAAVTAGAAFLITKKKKK